MLSEFSDLKSVPEVNQYPELPDCISEVRLGNDSVRAAWLFFTWLQTRQWWTLSLTICAAYAFETNVCPS